MNDRMKIKETELGLPYSHDVNVNKFNDNSLIIITKWAFVNK